jgi:retron-type reverse transcriptase
MISKPKDPNSKRPLTIISGNNKIVSMAINIVLISIFEGFNSNFVRSDSCGNKFNEKAKLEGIYKNTSHGFRPNRGVHTAINTVRT